MSTTKIVELFIDDEYDESGIEAISLVSRPAHDETWLAFKSDSCNCSKENMSDVEVEKLDSPYTIAEENFCDTNPRLDELGEPYSNLIKEGYTVVRVEKITPMEVYKMQEQKFSNPNEPSIQDSGNLLVRYKYIGPRDEKNRQFCREMLSKNRVYRIEDIEQLSNPEFGSYSIFLYRGSYNCRHAWVRLLYAKEDSPIRNTGSSTKGLLDQTVVVGLDTRNDATVLNPSPNSWKPGEARDGSIFVPGFNDFAEIGPKGGVKESKKAPKSDTPNPEPKGEGTAKGSAKTSRGAEVTQRVEDILKSKADDFNERYKDKLGYGVNVGMLKSVYQRGVGAYNVSHSPAVKSAEQWALARVNAFLYLVKNGRPENKKYDGDNDLLPGDHPKKQQMSSEEFQESISDYPEGVKNAAKRAVAYAEKNGWGSCGTGVGKQRASQLAKGENISVDTVKRMYSYLSRHKVDLESSKTYEEGCGKLMYDAWGGEAGLTWAERKLAQIEKEKMSEDRKELTVSDMKNWGGVQVDGKKLLFYDEDKRIVVGAAMVPHKMIHRYDAFGNIYYVFFSKASIKKMAEKFLRQKRTDETSIEHNGKKLGSNRVYVTESWVSEDPEKDKSAAYGFNLPAGTWFVSMKVEDPKIWKMIKSGELTGFSVEGLFAEKSYFSKEDKKINQIKQILKSIKDDK